jgi:hypothetical protein
MSVAPSVASSFIQGLLAQTASTREAVRRCDLGGLAKRLNVRDKQPFVQVDRDNCLITLCPGTGSSTTVPLTLSTAVLLAAKFRKLRVALDCHSVDSAQETDPLSLPPVTALFKWICAAARSAQAVHNFSGIRVRIVPTGKIGASKMEMFASSSPVVASSSAKQPPALVTLCIGCDTTESDFLAYFRLA